MPAAAELHDHFPGPDRNTRPSWPHEYPNGALLVAAGALDAFILFGGGPWDHAAPALIVTEAGGRHSDQDGTVTIDTSCAVFTNRIVHTELLEVLNSTSRTSPSNRAP